MRTPSIPALTTQDPALKAIKEVVECITAKRPGVAKIEPLKTTATTAQIITKINEIIDRLQA